jgi:cation diffusion facilitator CzcD-associated flavoprotein CzcO
MTSSKHSGQNPAAQSVNTLKKYLPFLCPSLTQQTLEYMKRTAPEKYHSILLPKNHLGQKRRVFDTDYLATLNRDNVHLTNDPISYITPTSLITKSGKEYPADVIILANGFLTQSFIAPMKFVNTSRGITLDSSPETGTWRSTGPEAYLGIPLFVNAFLLYIGCCVHGFPNLFLLMGPNTVTGHHSVIFTSECAINFTIRISRLVLTNHADSVEIKRQVQKRESEWMQKCFKTLVWTKSDGGTSLFKAFFFG